MPQYNNNSNFLNANNSTATNYPPISPSGGSNKPLAGNSASASATNQSNPPTPTDQNATMSPNRKNSKKVTTLYKFSKHFLQGSSRLLIFLIKL